MAKAAFLAVPAYTLNKLCSISKKKNPGKLVEKESPKVFYYFPKMNFANLLRLLETGCSASGERRSQSSTQSGLAGVPAAGRMWHMFHGKEEAITKIGLLCWVFPFFRREGRSVGGVPLWLPEAQDLFTLKLRGWESIEAHVFWGLIWGKNLYQKSFFYKK